MGIEQLRRDIDAGRTGDKRPGVDPAAAPLGTDDEAAGTPVPPALAEQERARALAVGPASGPDTRHNATPAASDTTPAGPRGATSGTVVAWLTMGVAVGLTIAAAVALFS